MSLRSVGPRLISENVDDVVEWVSRLQNCPPITRTKVALCQNPSHGGDPANWFYVEADVEEGVARLRCLAGGHVNDVLDSAEHWTYPGVWACPACGQSIAEVVFGINEADGSGRWMVIAVRCVECGEVAGVTDMTVDAMPIDELLSKL
ncbi:MAG TPA: hypothetical protein VHA79_05555 [Mycobacteriales bacterium]|nr:hypothetical protein [Mycobacteriales bacterium]HVX69139.1 hypothetical protein [Mycobacteriales bacterium]